MAVVVSDSGNSKYGTSVATITLASGGSGYAATNVLTLNAGDTNATLVVDTVDGSGVVLTFHRTAGGSGYSAASAVGVTGGSGTLATFDITVQAGMSTVNGFYRAEAYNLGCNYATAGLALTSYQTIPVTFANAGDCEGVILYLQQTTSSVPDRTVTARLQEAKTVGSFDTATEKVNIATHGIANDTPVSFSSTGTLPTGLTTNAIYYVINTATNDFQISTSVGGSAVLLSGTPTGTATCWVDRASKALTNDNIMTPNPEAGRAGYEYGQPFVPFEFDTPYTVDVTASKWRFHIFQSGGTAGTWYLIQSAAAAPFYVTWCNTAISFSDNDTLIVKDNLVIDKTITIAGILGTSETVNGNAGLICRNLDVTEDNVALLNWEINPPASYTFTIKTNLWMGTHSGFRVGTSTYPIPYAQQAIIYFDTPNTGTSAYSSIQRPAGVNASGAQGKMSMFLYGQVPTLIKTTLASQANTGQANIVTTDDTSAQWYADDYVVVGKVDSATQGTTTINQISSISGTTITLKANIPDYLRKVGATVFRTNRFGIKVYAVSNAAYGSIVLAQPTFFIVSGVEFLDVRLYNAPSSTYSAADEVRKQYLIQDCTSRQTSTTLTYLMTSSFIPREGMLMNRVYTFRSAICSGPYGYNSSATLKSGFLEVKNCVCISLGTTTNGSGGTTSTRQNWHDNRFENSGRYGLVLYGIECSATDNYFWGIAGNVASNYSALDIYQLVNTVSIARNTYNKCGVAILMAPYVTSDVVSEDDVFGDEVANTYDVSFAASAFMDFELRNPTGTLVFYTTYLPDTVNGSKFAVTNYLGTTNNDIQYRTEGYIQRCGDGLSDTTVHTSGTGKFSMRMESIDNGSFPFTQYIPTGNIQGLDMVVGVWVKINSANYYSGTHVMPTLSVDYDDGTVATAVAAESTDWQFLTVPFAPTTTYGRIKVTVSCETDQTTTSAYVYFDDFAILYPAGVQLNLGGIDLWAGAEPITPTLATNVSAADVWAYPTASLTASGTTGKQQKDLLTVGKFIGLK